MPLLRACATIDGTKEATVKADAVTVQGSKTEDVKDGSITISGSDVTIKGSSSVAIN